MPYYFLSNGASMSVKAEAEHLMGCLFIVAAPSGGGKTSLVQHLIEHTSDVVVSVSHTTRQQRPGEMHEEDYFFITPDVFHSMIEQQAFIEHAKVYDHFYGTSYAQITEPLQAGIDVILDIDWQGAQQIKKKFPDAVSIFIIPPTLSALEERLIQRQQDNQQVITQRMQKAQNELQHYAEFDYLIVNDSFAKAALELNMIVMAERLRTSRQALKQRKLLSFLLTSK